MVYWVKIRSTEGQMGVINPMNQINSIACSARADLSPALASLKTPISTRGFRGFLFGFNWCRFPNPKRDDSGTMIEKDRPTGLIWPTLCFLLSDDKEALTLHNFTGSVST